MNEWRQVAGGDITFRGFWDRELEVSEASGCPREYGSPPYPARPESRKLNIIFMIPRVIALQVHVLCIAQGKQVNHPAASAFTIASRDGIAKQYVPLALLVRTPLSMVTMVMGSYPSVVQELRVQPAETTSHYPGLHGCWWLTPPPWSISTLFSGPHPMNSACCPAHPFVLNQPPPTKV